MEQSKKEGIISFGFSKKIELKKLTGNAVNKNEHELTEESKDLIISVDNNRVKSSKSMEEKKEKKLFIIPLFPENTTNDNENLDNLAAQEILNETANSNKNWEHRDRVDPNLSLPLLMRSKGEVSENAEDANYESIPVEHFGVALLRGMGWKEDDNETKDKSVKSINSVPRLKGLGLGADRPSQKHRLGTNADGDNDEECLTLKKGAYCVVTKGAQKDMYGVIQGIDEDNARAIVKLTVTGQMCTLSQYVIQLVKQNEYEKNSQNDNRKATKNHNNDTLDSDKYKSSRKYEPVGERHVHKARKQGDDYHETHSEKTEDHHSRKRKHPKVKDHSNDDKHFHSNKHTSDSRMKHKHSASSQHKHVDIRDKLWVCPNLKVRIVDKSYKKGKYFKSKVVIIDVLSKDNCICQTENREILENLSQSQLETVIPKNSSTLNTFIMVINTSNKGRIGQIISRDKNSNKLLVRLFSSGLGNESVIQLDSFDHACEFVGKVDEEVDY